HAAVVHADLQPVERLRRRRTAGGGPERLGRGLDRLDGSASRLILELPAGHVLRLRLHPGASGEAAEGENDQGALPWFSCRGFCGGGAPGARVAPAELFFSCSRHCSRRVPVSSLQRSMPFRVGAGVWGALVVLPPLIAPSLGFASFPSGPCANAPAAAKSR